MITVLPTLDNPPTLLPLALTRLLQRIRERGILVLRLQLLVHLHHELVPLRGLASLASTLLRLTSTGHYT